MWFMGFSKANCQNCYACVRACPVHAIKVKNEQAQIIKERCIVCGRCFKVCPQNAKSIKSEKEMVKHYLRGRQKVVASVAPSFAAILGEHSNKLPTALKLLGFDYVEEAVSTVHPIIKEYEKYANRPGDDTYITSFCPSVNNIIEKYYPDLAKNIIPVVSPSIFNGRVLKNKYGKETRVVFIGPCLGKKNDGHNEESIDLVLTFEELEKWLKEENIELKDLKEEPFSCSSKQLRLLPTIGGLTNSIEAKNPRKSIIQVDGIKDCMQVLDFVKKGQFKNTLIEMSSCRHSCIGGSGMPEDGVNCYERRENLKKYAKSCCENSDKKDQVVENEFSNIDFDKEFSSKEVLLNQPNSEQLREILNNMGKYEKSDELNCKSCGYHTCREKGIAVYNNMAEINMCLPFMREKAEDLSNVIFNMTPNIIAIIDKELDFVQLNPSAEQFFKTSRQNIKGIPIEMFLEEEDFKKVKDTKKNIFKQRKSIKQNDATIIQSIIWLEKNQVILWIADDITKNEELQEKLQKMKIDAIDMAQKVINKQMTVAQEIASLLGETTAETKVTLTQLKNLILEDEVSM
ncbi:[Fe-Fe] hydrogenase large subunit C-terminal domain-containing protein [Romboutsia sedimentorum]|uniref:[Fe-Fe] hydrogenase large subunit C-terminal domain-containing protein n=1 Tax=Romboutsia sedimentorum TaxID=1368474 RepID=UPI0024DEFFC1|nr:[Fe-Fe] hydrogenase large subunit C-terminal domain-containing protein [Romboutsia sedimentorum]MDK2585426.1 [Fe-Fe] hydrogenase large subunit C-terminal domain-containing protein [Romboutsia sedimentorum]